MRGARGLLAVVLFLFAAASAAQNSCGDCRAAALAGHKACNAAAKDAPAFDACGRKMSDSMKACQEGACAADVARMYEGYCAGCLKQADTPAKKKACEESVCRKAAAK
jgi:hypothetical protein